MPSQLPQQLFLPNGESAQGMDTVMALSQWTKALAGEAKDQTKPFIAAGMGKPTFPMPAEMARTQLENWRTLLEKIDRETKDCFSKLDASEARDHVACSKTAFDYGLPQGDLAPRESVADSLNQQYKLEKNNRLTADNILFVGGGAGGLNIVFKVVNKKNPSGKIITTKPHYGLYSANNNNLFFVDVMKKRGYRLTGTALDKVAEQIVKDSKQDGSGINAFLFCDPHNPLGTMMGAAGWQEIATVLRQYPKVPIIVDEAYAGVQKDRHVSLLEVAPDLKDRVILLRSATKELSAAGDRMAIAVTCNPSLMQQLINENIQTIGHAPRSLQAAYAAGLTTLEKNREKIWQFYGAQVALVCEGLKKIGASMPDATYEPRGTFYVMADLSDLLGMPIPARAKRALGDRSICKTDQDIIYSLLFSEHIMVTPLSFYGMPPTLGYVRITCSGGDSELKELMKRLENKLIEARSLKKKQLIGKFDQELRELKQIDPIKAQALVLDYNAKLRAINDNDQAGMALRLKAKNELLSEFIQKTRHAILWHKDEKDSKAHDMPRNAAAEAKIKNAAIKILTLYSVFKDRQKAAVIVNNRKRMLQLFAEISKLSAATNHVKDELHKSSAMWRKRLMVSTFPQCAVAQQSASPSSASSSPAIVAARTPSPPVSPFLNSGSSSVSSSAHNSPARRAASDTAGLSPLDNGLLRAMPR